MPILSGAVVPHAPVLIEGVHPDPDLSAVRDAVKRVDLSEADVVVVVSPHGPEGVYRDNRAEMDSMGLGLPAMTVPHDPVFATNLSQLWGRPMLAGALDHGAAVVVRLLEPSAPVVCVSLGDEHPVRAAADLGPALVELAAGARIAMIASANLSAGLNTRAPLTLLPGAEDIESLTLFEAGEDAFVLTHRAADLAIVGGSCGGGPLTLFGRLFAGSPLEVLEYRRPFGVGYLVATAAA